MPDSLMIQPINFSAPGEQISSQPENQPSTTTTKISKICCWWLHLPSLFISSHVLKVLCKITGYEALQHGTSISNYFSILKSGGDPSKGRSTTQLANPGLKKAKIDNTMNHFYLLRDSNLGVVDGTAF